MLVSNPSNTDPSLNQRRKSQRKLPADAKKAHRAILRDGDDGYVASVPNPENVSSTEDLVLDLMLRVNALELTNNELNRKLMMLMGGGVRPQPAPFVEPTAASPSGNVVPMTPKPKTEEPSGSVVPGNEAENLDASAHQPLPTPSADEKVVHIHGTEVLATEVLGQKPAANDPDVSGSPRTTAPFGSEDALARIIERRFGMKRGEVFQLCKAEWQRREDHCLRVHNMTMVDVGIARTFRKRVSLDIPLELHDGVLRLRRYVPVSACQSNFKQFDRFCESGMNWNAVKARNVNERVGPAVRRKRAEARRKQDMMESNTVVGVAHRLRRSANFAAHVKRAEAIKPKRPPFKLALASSWDATKMGWRDSIDRWRNRLGMASVDWFKAERALYEHDEDANEYARRFPRLERMLKDPDYTPRIAIIGRSPRWYSGPRWPGENRDDHTRRFDAMSHDLIRKGLVDPMYATVLKGLIEENFSSSDTVAKTDD